MIVCTHEDRPRAWVGLKLLVLSLARHCPDLPVVVSCPNPTPALAGWLDGLRTVRRHTDPDLLGVGWNVKPTLLLALLEAGETDVVWIDADMALTADFRPRLGAPAADELVVTEEQGWGLFPGGTVRAELWGLAPGRSLPCTINSGLVRVTPAHRELLLAWQRLLAEPAYLRVQQRPVRERPIHMIGDQDVLTALTASRRFAHVPLRFLKRGEDVIQSVGPAGYTVRERLANVRRGLAPLVHCAGPKPWDCDPRATALGDPGRYYDRVFLELSVYAWVASRYRHELGAPLPGMDATTSIARVCRLLTGDHPTLRGLPLAAFHTLAKGLKRRLGISDWPTADANIRPGERPEGERIVAALGAGA